LTNPHSQVTYSQSFQKTVVLIAKEHVKVAIIDWLTEQDPIIGIVGRDLIGQIIDSKDEDQIIRSYADVISTMIFLDNMKKPIVATLNEHPEVLKQAEMLGWSKEKVVAYTTLYIFFSEKLKFKLYVSPYILNMRNTTKMIESLTTSSEKKWISIASRVIVNERRVHSNFGVDVRALELFQRILIGKLFNTSYKNSGANLFKALMRDYSKENVKWITEWQKANSITDIVEQQLLTTLLKNYDSLNIYTLNVQERLIYPILGQIQAVNVINYDYAIVKDQILFTIKDLFSSWLKDYKNNQVRPDYGLLLASIFYGNGNIVDLSLVDQVRFGYFSEGISFYAFTGGFIAPLLKKDTNKEYYPIGLGLSAGPYNITSEYEISYNTSHQGNGSVTVGYALPLEYLLSFI